VHATSRTVAREADAAEFDAIFSTEVNNDALATAQLMGSATERIQVGTWIANIYLRHSYVCAQGAALIRAAHRDPDRRLASHTHVEQHERALESRSPGPWLKSCRQFELIRDEFAETYPGQRAEQGSDISMPASYHLDAFNHRPGHTLRVQAGSGAHPRKCTRHTAAAS
jgi:hypothetical protein